jgi:ribonuclease HIII
VDPLGVLRQAGVTVDSSSPIDYGTQYRVSRGGNKAIVNVYQGKKGTRVVVQMNTALAAELRELLETPKAPAAELANIPTWPCWIGSDESGKGDFFGPLTVAAVGLTTASAAAIAKWRVRDSKTMSEGSILELDTKIRAALPFKLVGWMPDEYNRRYEAARSVNVLLGAAHGEAIASVFAQLPDARAAVVDQFGDEGHVERALKARNVALRLEQRPKADVTDLAVSAASVVARAAFVRGMAKLEKDWGLPLHKGAGPEVVENARAFLARHGREKLGAVAKLHFKTAGQL